MAQGTQTTPRPSGAVARRDPFLSLYRDVNRLFEDVFRGTIAPSVEEASSIISPRIEVSETESELRIGAELPGVSDADVDVSLNDDILTISAEKRQEQAEEKQNFYVIETSYGTFQRSIQLPYRVDPLQVRAQIENGVLNIVIPKPTQQQRTNRVQVQGPGEKAQGRQGQAPHNGQDKRQEAASTDSS
jgi:HSP20 family protein